MKKIWNEKFCNIAFIGNPAIAAGILEHIIITNSTFLHDDIYPKDFSGKQNRNTVKLVVTVADKPSGRGMQMSASPVGIVAQKHNIETIKLTTLDHAVTQEIIDRIKSLDIDLIIVVAFGFIVPKILLNCTYYGAINIHFSLLPTWRGASPVQMAVLMNNRKTGVSIMQMDEGLDTGGILYQQSIEIHDTDRASDVFANLSTLAKCMVIDFLSNIDHYRRLIINQVSINIPASYAKKIYLEDKKISCRTQSSEIICRKIKAFDCDGGVYCTAITSKNIIDSWVDYQAINHDECESIGLKLWNADLPNALERRIIADYLNDQNYSIDGKQFIYDKKIDGLCILCLNNSVLLIRECQLPNKKRILGRDIYLMFKSSNIIYIN